MAGWDMIIFEGKSLEAGVSEYLENDQGRVACRPMRPLGHQSVWATDELAAQALHQDPATENRLPSAVPPNRAASIRAGYQRFAPRRRAAAGVGTVMASKKPQGGSDPGHQRRRQYQGSRNGFMAGDQRRPSRYWRKTPSPARACRPTAPRC